MCKEYFRAFQYKLEIHELLLSMIQILPIYLQREVIFTKAGKAIFAGTKWKILIWRPLKKNFKAVCE